MAQQSSREQQISSNPQQGGKTEQNVERSSSERGYQSQRQGQGQQQQSTRSRDLGEQQSQSPSRSQERDV